MPDLLFFAVPAFVLGAALVFVRLHRTKVRAVLETTARRRRGRVEKGPWFLFPRLVLPVDGAELQVSARHGSQGHARCTFAWIGCTEYPDAGFDVRRSPGRVGMLEKLGQERPSTGHPAFDQSFWLHAEDPKFANSLLDRDLRKALLDFDPRLHVRLRIGKTLAYRDGLPKSDMEPSLEVAVRRIPVEPKDVERMIDLALLVHERLLRADRARAA